MKERAWKIGRFVLTRTVTVLFIAGLCLAAFGHGKEALGNARLKTLNRVLPASMKYLVDLNRRSERPDAKKLEPYLHYYHLVEKYVPPMPETFDVLGYIYAQLGNRPQAIRYYEKSVALNGQFFWSHYNLGVLYVQEGSYTKAVEQFKKALQSPPQVTVLVFAKSKIYQQILVQVDDLPRQLQQGMNLGLKDAYRLLILSSRLAKVHPPSPPEVLQNVPYFLF